jgi:hypothetical protein
VPYLPVVREKSLGFVPSITTWDIAVVVVVIYLMTSAYVSLVCLGAARILRIDEASSARTSVL